jgi:Protein of unknown function (DUF1822)
MKYGLTHFQIIDAAQIWLAFSPEDENQILLSVKDYSYEAARWNAYLNLLCLNAFISWTKEHLYLTETLLLLPTEDECHKLWEFLNGTAFKLGETRIVLIPTEDSIVEEFGVQQEWIDVPGWEAHYYISMQVNPEARWLRVLGYTQHKTIKEKGKYDPITRAYYLPRTQLIPDLNFMWMEQEVFSKKNVATKPLPKLSPLEAKKLVEEFDIPLWCSPRLDLKFENWAAILADSNLRKLLYKQPVAAYVAPKSVNLSNWLQGIFEISWLKVDEILERRKPAYGWRGRGSQGFKENTTDDKSVIPGLVELLQSKTDEEKRLKAAEFLGAIAPGHPVAITALIELLNTSKNKLTRWQAIDSLGEIGTGNQQAIAALTTVLSNEDNDIRWQAALSLGKIDPSNARAGVSRCRQIDLGMQLAGHPVALVVYLMSGDDDKVVVLLRVRPTGSDVYLPPNLQLIVLSSEKVILQAQARNTDNWIQQQFTYQAGDSFSVKVALGDVSHTEEFVS